MRRISGVLLASILVLALAVPATAAPPERATPGSGETGLDVLFVGSHPDDEASRLSTFGQWHEYHDITTGVVTITRGEGGGNAIGPEEGAELGLIREDEERRAVGWAGIERVYNFDFVDFWYNLSAPLTEEIWERDDPDALLERLVRVIRMTQPGVIVTMNPGINHGHHQYAAWLAVEAFYAAADPTVFPEQLSSEKLEPWRVGKIYTTRAQGSGATGSACEADFTPAEPTDAVHGVWSGRWSERHGTTWAQVQRQAQREYASQGWAVFPDVPSDPEQLGCDRQTLIDSRVPTTEGNTDPLAMLEGAVLPADGGLPLGSELYVTTDRFHAGAGEPIQVTVHARNGGTRALRDAHIELAVPDGWTVEGSGELGNLVRDRERTASFTVTPAADEQPGRSRIEATLTTAQATGWAHRVVEVVPAVQGNVELHPDVARFREWTREVGAEQVDSLIRPQVAIAQGETRDVRVDLVNNSSEPRSGEVMIDLPNGFEAQAETLAFELEGSDTGALVFEVTNTDLDLPTANEGGVNGEYRFTVTTTSDAGSSSELAALNLVPSTTIPQAEVEPTLDATANPGEYPGEELDLSRRWEGAAPDGPKDASGTTRVSWYDDALYVLVEVTDDVLGAVVTPEDAKRHWRTDSIEITIDPRGDSRDTSTAFKAGLFPLTDDPEAGNPPGGSRDADNHQGPLDETAPDMELAAHVTDPYEGYVIEARIPMEELPAAVDPDRMGLNILIYDSDTQNLTGQTRLGWSTFGGVQASPYRWGTATLEGYTPPPDRSTEPAEPIIPDEVTRSVESPQSVEQSTIDGVPLASAAPAPVPVQQRMASDPVVDGDRLHMTLSTTAPGTAHVFAWTGSQMAGSTTVALQRGQPQEVVVDLDPELRDELLDGGRVLVGFETNAGGTRALRAPISP